MAVHHAVAAELAALKITRGQDFTLHALAQVGLAFGKDAARRIIRDESAKIRQYQCWQQENARR